MGAKGLQVCRKRLEKQIQDMESESEGKKMEVCSAISYGARKFVNDDIAGISAADADTAGTAVNMPNWRRATPPSTMSRRESKASGYGPDGYYVQQQS